MSLHLRNYIHFGLALVALVPLSFEQNLNDMKERQQQGITPEAPRTLQHYCKKVLAAIIHGLSRSSWMREWMTRRASELSELLQPPRFSWTMPPFRSRAAAAAAEHALWCFGVWRNTWMGGRRLKKQAATINLVPKQTHAQFCEKVPIYPPGLQKVPSNV